MLHGETMELLDKSIDFPIELSKFLKYQCLKQKQTFKRLKMVL